jgi:hypothetical protein
VKTRLLLSAGIIAGPLFIAVMLLEGATRVGYDPMRHPISSLALGDHGWMQTATFLATGILSLLFAIGLTSSLAARPRLAAILVGLWGAAMVGAGLFTTDPVSGYPAGTPAVPVGTASGMLHNLCALVGALTIIVACVTLRREGGPGWSAYSLGTGAFFLITFGLASAGFGQAGLVDVAGLLQRAAVIAAWTWLTVLAVRQSRALSRA